MARYRLMLAEDQALLREGLKRILEKEPGLKVVAEVKDGLELLESLKTTATDMILLGISLPNLQSLKTLKAIKRHYPHLKILILTMQKSAGHLLTAFSAGADGYLLKSDAYEDLFAAIAKVRQGENYISKLISDEIINIFRPNGGEISLEKSLSKREKEVLELLSQGKTGREISEHLGVSVPTVQTYRNSLKKKLNISSNTALIKYALEKGISLLPDN